MTTQDEHVHRVDARTATPAFQQDLLQEMFFPLVDHGSVWVIAGARTPQVWRLNPDTLAQDATIGFPKQFPYGLAAGNGALWTVDADTGAVWRIDPGTNKATRLATVAHHPIAVAAGEGRLGRRPGRTAALGGFDETPARPSGHAARPEAASSVAPIATAIGTPCVLASERPAHPESEQRSAKPS